MATTMLNVRLDKGLKLEGDRVMAKQGVSATQAIRGLYRFMEENQDVPDFCKAGSDSSGPDERRRAMRRLVGIAKLKPGEDLNTLRNERLSRLGV